MGNTFFTTALAVLLLTLYHTANLTVVFADDPWSEFLQLSNYSVGQKDPKLIGVKQYLVHFGYLDQGGKLELSTEFDADLEGALKKYQQFYGLQASGVLDQATVNQLVQPRCGVSDLGASAPTGKPGHLVSANAWGKAHFVIGGKPWSPTRRNLTYFISADNQPLAKSDLSSVFGKAFKTWSEFAPFTFREVADQGTADLRIGFFRGGHGDGQPFDGPLGVLAHAFYPENGRTHFDAAENWMIDPTKLAATRSSMDLLSVAIHEIGHLLGLAHSNDQSAVMYAYMNPQTQKQVLASDDLQGIQRLYLPPCC